MLSDSSDGPLWDVSPSNLAWVEELYYSYQMTRQHKTAAQIRKSIIAGEWKTIDLQSATTIN